MNRNLDSNDIELQDFGIGRAFHNIPLEHSNTLQIGAEVFHEKEAQRKRSWGTILGLSVLAALLLITTVAFSALYVAQISKPPDVHFLTSTAFLSTTWTVTALDTTTLVSTHDRPTTQTVTFIATDLQTKTRVRTSVLTSLVPTTISDTQRVTVTTTITTTDTIKKQAKPSSFTSVVTTTTYLTTTTVTSMAPTATTLSSGDNTCAPGAAYGGEELHVLNPGYDLAIADAVRSVASAGLDIASVDPMTIGLRSIFSCVVGNRLDLVVVCGRGYIRTAGDITCDGQAYTPSSGFASTPRVVPVFSTSMNVTTRIFTHSVMLTVTGP